ncbi:MAG: serine/threonine-protein kinase, partial [Candidatus Omnitrophota bacterium]
DKAEIIEIAKIVSSYDGEAGAEHFEKFGLDPATDKDEIFNIAKFCARSRGRDTAKYFKNFGFDPKTDMSMIIEIAKLCAMQNAIMAYFFKEFGIDPQKGRQQWQATEEIAMLCAKNEGSAWAAAMYFKKFGFLPQKNEADKAVAIKVAGQCAKLEGQLTAKYFKEFMLDPQEDRDEVIKIAKLCAIQDLEGTLKYFDNFGLGFTKDGAQEFCREARRERIVGRAQSFGDSSLLHKFATAGDTMRETDEAFAFLGLSGFSGGTRSYVKLLLLEEAVNKGSISDEFRENLKDKVIPHLRALEVLVEGYPQLGLEEGTYRWKAGDRDETVLKEEVIDFIARVELPGEPAGLTEERDGAERRAMPLAPYPIFHLLAGKMAQMGLVDQSLYSSNVAGNFVKEAMPILSILFYSGYPAGKLPEIGGKVSPEIREREHPVAGPEGELVPAYDTQFFYSLEPASMEEDIRRTFLTASAAAAKLGAYGEKHDELAGIYRDLRTDIMRFFLQKMKLTSKDFEWSFSDLTNFSEYYLHKETITAQMTTAAKRFDANEDLHQEFKDIVERHIRRIEKHIFPDRLKTLMDMALKGEFSDMKPEVLISCYDDDPEVRDKAQDIAAAAYPEEWSQIVRREERKTNRKFFDTGLISQGTKAEKEFRAKLDQIRQPHNDITERYAARVMELIEKFLAKGTISAEDREGISAIKEKFENGEYTIYGYNSIIVKAENDFHLGENDPDAGELFIATDVIAELEYRGKSIADEYLLHEIICPVVKHYSSIKAQQAVFNGETFGDNYPDKDALSKQTSKYLYKGLLGEALRDMLDGPRQGLDELFAYYAEDEFKRIRPEKSSARDLLSYKEILERMKEQNWLYAMNVPNKQTESLVPFDGRGIRKRTMAMKRGIESCIYKKLPKILEKLGLPENEPLRIYASGSYFWLEGSADDIEIDIVVDSDCPFTEVEALSRDEVRGIFEDLGRDALGIKINVFGKDQLELAAKGKKVESRAKLCEKLIQLPYEAIQFSGKKITFPELDEKLASNILSLYDIYKEHAARSKWPDLASGSKRETMRKEWFAVKIRGILEYVVKNLEEFNKTTESRYFGNYALGEAFLHGRLPTNSDPRVKEGGGTLNAMLAGGNVFEGNYRILSKVGKGGGGAVYRAYDIARQRVVALKLIGTEQGVERDGVVRFKREAKLSKRLEYEGIMPVLDSFDTSKNRTYFYTMELIRGITLGDFCASKEHTEKEKGLIFLHVAEALAYARKKGVIHRDIKPGNIIVRRSAPDDPRPVIIDLGIATLGADADTQVSQLTKTGASMGTPDYKSPEQVRAEYRAMLEIKEKNEERRIQRLGLKEAEKKKLIEHIKSQIERERKRVGLLDVDKDSEPEQLYKTDVFSLGVVMYEAATGRSPFESKDLAGPITTRFKKITLPRKLNPEISRSFEAVIMKCLEFNPRNRYTSEGLAEELKRISRGKISKEYLRRLTN